MFLAIGAGDSAHDLCPDPPALRRGCLRRPPNRIIRGQIELVNWFTAQWMVLSIVAAPRSRGVAFEPNRVRRLQENYERAAALTPPGISASSLLARSRVAGSNLAGDATRSSCAPIAARRPRDVAGSCMSACDRAWAKPPPPPRLPISTPGSPGHIGSSAVCREQSDQRRRRKSQRNRLGHTPWQLRPRCR
jgi:hypothetical protein